MQYKINWSPKALEDILKIVTYLSIHWTDIQLNEFYKNLEYYTNLLKTHPFSNPQSKIKKYRKINIDKYNILIYSVNKKTKLIQIIAVFDGRQLHNKIKNI